MSSLELAKIKRRVTLLDLSCLQAAFVKEIKEEWGFMKWQGDNEEDLPPPLQCVANYFGGSFDGFAKLVEREYKLFLVVKCVEVLAKEIPQSLDDSNRQIAMWLERCSPTKVRTLVIRMPTFGL